MPQLTFAVPGKPMGWKRVKYRSFMNDLEMNARQEAIRLFVVNTIQLSREFKSTDFPLPVDVPIVLTVQGFFKTKDKKKWGKIRLATPDMSNLQYMLELPI